MAPWCQNMWQLAPDMKRGLWPVVLYFNGCILLVFKKTACKKMDGMNTTYNMVYLLWAIINFRISHALNNIQRFTTSNARRWYKYITFLRSLVTCDMFGVMVIAQWLFIASWPCILPPAHTHYQPGVLPFQLRQRLLNVRVETIGCRPKHVHLDILLGLILLFCRWTVFFVLVVIFADWLGGATTAHDEPELCHQLLQKWNLQRNNQRFT